MTPKRSRRCRVSSFSVGGDEYVVISVPQRQTLPSRLTPAEREIVSMVLGGRNNQEIARARQVALSTIVNQLRRIFEKLGVGSRYELVAKLSRD